MADIETSNTLQELKTTCGVCGKEIVGIDNFIDAGDDVVCSQECLRIAIGRFERWQNGHNV